jgi:hypothetical protein
MKYFYPLKSAMIGVLGLFLAVNALQASFSTNYGSFSGLDVNFLNVSESTITENTALYRDPIVSLNTIDFNPQGFGAFASGAGGFDLTDGELTMIIQANPGKSIPSINFWEVGDFTLAGPGTAATWVDVTANFYINVYEVNGSPITPLNINGSMTFAPVANGLLTLPLNPGVGDPWSGAYSLDLDAALALAGYTGGATRVSFKLDNELFALSEAGTVARIQKKDFQGSVGIEVIVPEPTTLTMILCGGVAILMRSRNGKK